MRWAGLGMWTACTAGDVENKVVQGLLSKPYVLYRGADLIRNGRGCQRGRFNL